MRSTSMYKLPIYLIFLALLVALPARKAPLEIYATPAVRRIVSAHMEIDESARGAVREYLRHPRRRDGR